MVVLGVSVSNKLPVSLLLAKVESSGVGDEDGSDDETEEGEPRDDEELCLGLDVGVEDGREHGSELSTGGREPVAG